MIQYLSTDSRTQTWATYGDLTNGRLPPRLRAFHGVERDSPTAQYDIAEHWRRPGWKGERISKKHLLFCTGKEESEDSQVQNKES